jgi:hypothetical protein
MPGGLAAAEIFGRVQTLDRQTGKRFEYRLAFCGFIVVGIAHQWFPHT